MCLLSDNNQELLGSAFYVAIDNWSQAFSLVQKAPNNLSFQMDILKKEEKWPKKHSQQSHWDPYSWKNGWRWCIVETDRYEPKKEVLETTRAKCWGSEFSMSVFFKHFFILFFWYCGSHWPGAIKKTRMAGQ